jgi:hypothetical protein
MLSITLLSHYAETGKDGPTEDQLRYMGVSNSKATVDCMLQQLNIVTTSLIHDIRYYYTDEFHQRPAITSPSL